MFKLLAQLVAQIKAFFDKWGPVPAEVMIKITMNALQLIANPPDIKVSESLRQWCRMLADALIDVVAATPTQIDDKMRDIFVAILQSDAAWAQAFALIQQLEGEPTQGGLNGLKSPADVVDALKAGGVEANESDVAAAIDLVSKATKAFAK